jgi:hypothetical protein
VEITSVTPAESCAAADEVAFARVVALLEGG